MSMRTGFGAAESLYDLQALDQVPLEAKVLSSQITNGVYTEEISYVSEIWNDKPVVITRKLVAPMGATNLPAIVGYYDPMVAQHGYVGLSVDYGKGIGLGGWYTVKPSPRHSGLYHGAVALIRAVSYLRSRPEVNPEAIGVTGGSINGMMACYLAGIDPRIKATVTEFGCGHIFDTWRWGADLSNVLAADRQVFEAQVDPGAYQSRIKAPILFAGGAGGDPGQRAG